MTTKKQLIEEKRREANARVWHVPCPRDYCGADVGEECRSSLGNSTWPHMPRREAAGEFDGG